MSDLRKLNSAVQTAGFPSHDFAQAVREWIDKATERMDPEPLLQPAYECPNCLKMYSFTETENHYNMETRLHTCVQKPASEPCPNCDGEKLITMTVNGVTTTSIIRPEPAKVECHVCKSPVDLFNKHARFNHDTETWNYAYEPAPPSCDECREPSIGERGGLKFCGDHLPPDLRKPTPPSETPEAHEDAEFMRAGALSMARIIERDEKEEPAPPSEMPEAVPFSEVGHDGKLVAETTDGMAWAKEFCSRMRRGLFGGPIDEGMMVGWFANAIEAGRTAGRSQPAPALRMTPELDLCLRSLRDVCNHYGIVGCMGKDRVEEIASAIDRWLAGLAK